MSMKQDTQDFEPLRRLLALKRHETPPPGYFDRFSGEIIARIKAGRHVEEGGWVERLLWEAPWLRRIWASVEASPILVGACSMAACGLLIGGVVYSDKAEVPPVGLVTVVESAPEPGPTTVMAAKDHPLLAKPAALAGVSSISPIATLPTGGPMLGGIGELQAQRVGWTLPSAH